MGPFGLADFRTPVTIVEQGLCHLAGVILEERLGKTCQSQVLRYRAKFTVLLGVPGQSI